MNLELLEVLAKATPAGFRWVTMGGRHILVQGSGGAGAGQSSPGKPIDTVKEAWFSTGSQGASGLQTVLSHAGKSEVQVIKHPSKEDAKITANALSRAGFKTMNMNVAQAKVAQSKEKPREAFKEGAIKAGAPLGKPASSGPVKPTVGSGSGSSHKTPEGRMSMSVRMKSVFSSPEMRARIAAGRKASAEAKRKALEGK